MKTYGIIKCIIKCNFFVRSILYYILKHTFKTRFSWINDSIRLESCSREAGLGGFMDPSTLEVSPITLDVSDSASDKSPPCSALCREAAILHKICLPVCLFQKYYKPIIYTGENKKLLSVENTNDTRNVLLLCFCFVWQVVCSIQDRIILHVTFSSTCKKFAN